MGKKSPEYAIQLHTEDADREEIKEIITKWYLQLAMQQIGKLNHREREMLIQRLKAALEGANILGL